MSFDLFFQGLLIGFLVSFPVGPMAVLVIQRTANRNFKSGFYTGLGIAITDSLWALIAGFSVSYIITFLRTYQSLIQAIGGIVVLFLGIYIFRSHPISSIRKFRRKGTNSFQCFITAMLFALSNPAVILVYIAVFASSNIMFNINHLFSPLEFILGFLMGAVSWWLFLTYSINHFRHHFNLRILWWFNKISGVLIILFVFISALVIIFKGNPNF